MRKSFLLLFLVTFTAITAMSQTTEDSVKSVISRLTSSMRKSDGIAIMGCFGDSALYQTVVHDKSGRFFVKNERLLDFANSFMAVPKEAAEERVNFDVVNINGPLASVWISYKFYYNGSVVFCGIASFQIVRSFGQWRIQYMIDTRETKGCD